LRDKASKAYDEWQRVKADSTKNLSNISNACSARNEQQINRQKAAMEAYFGAQLSYIQTWKNYALSQLGKARGVSETQNTKLKDIQEQMDLEAKDRQALQDKLDHLPKDGTSDVRKEGEDLKAQIASIQKDLEETDKMLRINQQDAEALKANFEIREQSIEKRQVEVKSARGLWQAVYDRSLQTYYNKCTPQPNFGQLPRPDPPK
jgi:hypothetical protein